MSDNWYKVKNYEHLRRDPRSNAILNINEQEAKEYQLRSKVLNSSRANMEEINSIKEKLSKVDSLECELKEIKELLQRIVNK